MNINTVVGNGIGQPEDALTIARRAREFGFGTSVGVIHDAGGQMRPARRRPAARACGDFGASAGVSSRTRTIRCFRRI